MPEPNPSMNRTLELLPGHFAICRLNADAPLPPWAVGHAFLSLTRTADELSVVCTEDRIPANIRCERGWRCVRLQGIIPFSETGVLAGLVEPLARAKVSIFAVSTFDTDYVLVKDEQLEVAMEAWQAAGYLVWPIDRTNEE